MKKIFAILLLLILVTIVYAADVKWSALAELAAVADDDVLCVIDTSAGSSKKITVLNFFDTIDTFAELDTIVADKTLINEEDAKTFDSVMTFSDAITLSDAATIDQSANNYIDLSDNSDTLQAYFGGTDVDILWSDGALNLRNAEDGTDAIVEIEGKDDGEKGILRVLSDGDDKYIELYDDDTDAVLTNSAGNIIINPVGLGVVIGDNGDEDYTLTFDGDTSNGVLNYDEDNADFEFDQDVSTAGTFTATTSVISPLFDAAGAEDMDYGSVDVTDHTFTTDDMTLIMDGGITVSTGDFIKIGTTQWNSADEIDGTKIKDADYGDVDVSAGGAWTLDSDSVADNEIDYTAVTGADLTLTDCGAITSTGTITATVGFDIVGAADIDYGSVDVTDHTFSTDGTGTAEIVLPAGSIDSTEILDATVTEVDLNVTNAPGAGEDNYVLTYNHAGTNFTWAADATGGTTAWDDIADPDNSGLTTITFDNAELSLLTGDNDAGASFFTIQNTDADHTVGSLYLLDLDYSADDGDPQADYFKCQDSGGVVLTIQQNGDLVSTGKLEGASINEGGVGVPNLDETDWVAAAEMADADHGDVAWSGGVAYVQAATIADSTYASCYVGLFQAATGNNEPFYTDGALTYDATSGTLSATVLTEGGTAVYNSGESCGGSLGGTWANPTIDDLFIKLGGDTITAGTYDFTAATLTMPKRTSNDDRSYSFNLWNPNALYDNDTQFCFEPNLPAAITITEVQISCDADPATELDLDLKFADAFIGLANATLIEPVDTTNGTTDIDSGFDDATVPAAKCLYLEFGADPDSNIKQAIVKIRYDYD